MVTLDTKTLAWRERDLQRAFLQFLRGKGLANDFSDPAFRGLLQSSPEDDPMAAIQLCARLFSARALTWDDLAKLRRMTDLPLILKGILHPEDARRAMRAGVDGIVVSNHGGRRVSDVVAALDALPACRTLSLTASTSCLTAEFAAAPTC